MSSTLVTKASIHTYNIYVDTLILPAIILKLSPSTICLSELLGPVIGQIVEGENFQKQSSMMGTHYTKTKTQFWVFEQSLKTMQR